MRAKQKQIKSVQNTLNWYSLRETTTAMSMEIREARGKDDFSAVLSVCAAVVAALFFPFSALLHFILIRRYSLSSKILCLFIAFLDFTL